MTVQQLAEELKTSEANVITWANEFNLNDERLDGDEVPRLIANYVRTQHLKATHPQLFRTLDRVYDSKLAYERWVIMISRTIGELRDKSIMP